MEALPTSTPSSRIDAITQQLRLRICLMDPSQSHLLYENSLAEEFGVSRTPVRQALQRLAYEHQVETRTGIGTVVPKLDPDGALHDVTMLAGALDLAAQAEDVALDWDARQIVAALARQGLRGEAADIFAFHSGLITLAQQLNPEPIMADAAASLHWRCLRRFLQQDAATRADHGRILAHLCLELQQHESRCAVFGTLATAMRKLGRGFKRPA